MTRFVKRSIVQAEFERLQAREHRAPREAPAESDCRAPLVEADAAVLEDGMDFACK